MDDLSLTIWVVFIGGLASFFSPCILPIFPSFIAYLTGVHVKQDTKRSTLPYTIAFLIGFSAVFILLGISIGFMGPLLSKYDSIIRYVGGAFIIFWGVIMLGIIQPKIIMKTFMISPPNNGLGGILGAFFIGLTFAVGWTPCIGPILASVLTLSMTNPDQALVYMIFYVAGFSIPFLAFSIFVTKIKGMFKYTNAITKIGGILFILMGYLLITNQLSQITIWLVDTFK
jgi:cytochrome c-type biogenesis protein